MLAHYQPPCYCNPFSIFKYPSVYGSFAALLQFVRYTTSPFLPHTPASQTFSGPDMASPSELLALFSQALAAKYGHPPSKTFFDAVPGLLWLGLCQTAALVRGASVGHISLPQLPPKYLAGCGTNGVVDARPVRQKHLVEMGIPVLRLVDGHLHQHVSKCLVYPLYQTVTLWVVGRGPGLGNVEQPAYLSYYLYLKLRP
ncbi:hypothetical protein T07_3078 [Trichinella nelsoni]|uniref:Uncharacterized protein n=1 Tax=Trichinella nelsoni TaxID=6336 RepID=A0A0V0RVZ0_9BILA|nr:hypothetical protein T07_3078 [Trichinella nelsoni]